MKRILLISHQLDYSGAPIALLAFGRSLLRQGHEVFLDYLRSGDLAEAFWRAGILKFNGWTQRPRDFDLVVANTVVSVPAALRFARDPGKVLAWIHESQYFFDVLRRKPAYYGLDRLRHAAFPSAFQRDEFQPHMPDTNRFILRNCVEPAYEAPCDEVPDIPYFVCAGAWEERKSQHRLVALLRQGGIREAIHFVGADRPADVLEPYFIFTGKVPPPAARQRISRSVGVISASRAETQNLVAIEAMCSGLPVLLSNIPAHRELQGLIPQVQLFDPEHLHSFRAGLNVMRRHGEDPNARRELQRGAATFFGRDAFDRCVDDLLRQMG